MSENQLETFHQWLGFDPGFPTGSQASFTGNDLVLLTLPLDSTQALRLLKEVFTRNGFPLSDEKSLPNEGKYRFISEARKFYLHLRADSTREQTLINLTDATEQSDEKFRRVVGRLLESARAEGTGGLESGTLGIPWQKPEGTVREAMDRVDALLESVMHEYGFTQHAASHPEDGIYLYTSGNQAVEAHFFPSIEDPYNKWGDGMGFIISMRFSADPVQEL